MKGSCIECICRHGYDIFNQDSKPCEHWIRFNCPKFENGNPCSQCSETITECAAHKENSERIEECLEAVNKVYDDGERVCPLIDQEGCEACYKRLMEADE